MAPAIAHVAIKCMENEMSKTSKKVKKAKLTGHVRRPEGPTGRFWTQWIKPRGVAYLAQRSIPCHFVIKNHGPETVRFFAEHGDHLDLFAGDVRATYASSTITVENGSEKWVLIEFDFLPIFRK
jgi:hypothetical protein